MLILSGIGMAFIFLVLGLIFWPFLILIPFALIAGVVAEVMNRAWINKTGKSLKQWMKE